MFEIRQDPSSRNLVQCLAKNYTNDSITSIDMDGVGVVAAYSDPLHVCSSLYRKALPWIIKCLIVFLQFEGNLIFLTFALLIKKECDIGQ